MGGHATTQQHAVHSLGPRPTHSMHSVHSAACTAQHARTSHSEFSENRGEMVVLLRQRGGHRAAQQGSVMQKGASCCTSSPTSSGALQAPCPPAPAARRPERTGSGSRRWLPAPGGSTPPMCGRPCTRGGGRGRASALQRAWSPARAALQHSCSPREAAGPRARGGELEAGQARLGQIGRAIVQQYQLCNRLIVVQRKGKLLQAAGVGQRGVAKGDRLRRPAETTGGGGEASGHVWAQGPFRARLRRNRAACPAASQAGGPHPSRLRVEKVSWIE